MGGSVFASLGPEAGISLDIPPACDTGVALFQVAGRTGISHGQHTPPPTLHSFDCGHYAGQLIKLKGYITTGLSKHQFLLC